MCVQPKVTKAQGDDWLREENQKKLTVFFSLQNAPNKYSKAKMLDSENLHSKDRQNLKVPEPKLCKVDIKKEGPRLGKF